MSRRASSRDRGFRRAVGVCLALVVLVAAASAAFLLLRMPPSVLLKPPRTPVPSAPSPVPVSPVARKMAHDVPRLIAIPSVGITAPVVPVGLTRDGAMAVPAGPDTAGWFKIGTYPGDRGSAVIAGHSGFAKRSAAFDPLTRVRRGDVVYVRESKGDRLAFKVVGLREYPADAQASEVFGRNDGAYLNLISCTGAWNSGLGTHSKRLVVFTRLVR